MGCGAIRETVNHDDYIVNEGRKDKRMKRIDGRRKSTMFDDIILENLTIVSEKIKE